MEVFTEIMTKKEFIVLNNTVECISTLVDPRQRKMSPGGCCGVCCLLRVAAVVDVKRMWNLPSF